MKEDNDLIMQDLDKQLELLKRESNFVLSSDFNEKLLFAISQKEPLIYNRYLRIAMNVAAIFLLVILNVLIFKFGLSSTGSDLEEIAGDEDRIEISFDQTEFYYMYNYEFADKIAQR